MEKKNIGIGLNRRKFLGFVGLAAAGAAIPAHGGTPAPSRVNVKRGGEARSAWYWTLDTPDAHLTTLSWGYDFSLLYDTLVRYDLVDEKAGKFEIRPELAESWEHPNDTTVLFKLRKGVKFHDGSDLNADVVKYNLERMRDHPKSAAKALLTSVATVEVVDPFTVKVTTKKPTPSLLINLSLAGGGCNVGIVSKAQMEKLGENGFNANPSGTGPMQLVEWRKDDRLILKRFDGYWKSGVDGRPLPYLDRYVSRFIADPTVALAEIRSGTVDLTTQVDAKDVPTVTGNPNLVYQMNPFYGRIYMTMGLNQTKGAFKDNLKLRQAALYAINREALAKILALGIGRAHYYPYWNEGMLGYDATLPRYDFQPDKAKALLKDAGLGGGVDVTVSVINRPADTNAAQVLKSMWDAVGIRTKLETLERLAWIDKVKALNYEVCFWGAGPAADSDINRTYLTTGAPSNWSGYSNKKVDQLFDEAGSTYDAQTRGRAYREIQQLIFNDALLTTGYFLPWNFVYQKYVKGLITAFSAVDLKEVWLDK